MNPLYICECVIYVIRNGCEWKRGKMLLFIYKCTGNTFHPYKLFNIFKSDCDKGERKCNDF
ncbi:hypothetical protein Hanom_Chr02g00164031 [Helianthus anomalus]